MLRKPRLFTPGPAPLHPRALEAAVRPLPHHRSEAFAACFGRVQEGLRRVFRTAGPVAVLTSSGTGAMEAAVANLFAPGDRVAVVAAGKFGRRWAEIAGAYGMETRVLELEPGRSASPRQVAEHLRRQGPVAGVLLTASETSTGAALDVAGVAAAAREVDGAMAVVVDAIGAIGALPVATDEWGLDAVVGASQKALMIPPGLGFVACSPRGWERVRGRRETPRYYWDLRRYADAAARDQTPFTPAISLLQALEAALGAIEEAGGIAALEANAARLAAATRAAASALGLEVLAEAPSPAVTALRVPGPQGGARIVARLQRRFGAQVAGGQGPLRGGLVRIGHLGYLDEMDLLGLVGALEGVLAEDGHPVEGGAGVAAASAVLAGEAPAYAPEDRERA